VGRIQQ
jgi:hypothetical protein